MPFRDGQSISDSQLRPRMYKSKKAFLKSYPGYYLGTAGVELVEYAEVVRCEHCKHSRWDEENKMYRCVESAEYDSELGDYIGFTSYHNADYFCSYGERREGE